MTPNFSSTKYTEVFTISVYTQNIDTVLCLLYRHPRSALTPLTTGQPRGSSRPTELFADNTARRRTSEMLEYKAVGDIIAENECIGDYSIQLNAYLKVYFKYLNI